MRMRHRTRRNRAEISCSCREQKNGFGGVDSVQKDRSGRACSTNKDSKIRKNIRLKDYDYKTNGAYFVTICTDFKRRYISKKERLVLEQELLSLQERFAGVKIDFYVIMPNHVHFVLFLHNCAVSLSRIIQVFKSVTTVQLKRGGFNERVFWQRNFFEHVIRNEEALTKIRKYIIDNPVAERIDMEKMYDE